MRACFPPWHQRSEEQVLQRACRRAWGLPWVWFGWEKHRAGRWQPEHVGRPLCQLNGLAVCRTQVKTGPLDERGRGTCILGGITGASCP